MKHARLVSIASALIVALAAALVPLERAVACPAVDCFIHAVDGQTGIVTAGDATGPAFQFAVHPALLPRLKVGQKVWFDPSSQVVSIEGAPNCCILVQLWTLPPFGGQPGSEIQTPRRPEVSSGGTPPRTARRQMAMRPRTMQKAPPPSGPSEVATPPAPIGSAGTAASPTTVAQVQPQPRQSPPKAPNMQPSGSVPQSVLKAEQITTSEQLDSLPDNQVIDIKGTMATAGEIRARMRQASARAEARMKQAAQNALAEFEARRARFEQEQKAWLERENAKVRAEFERLRQQLPKLVPHTPSVPQATGRDVQLNEIRKEARQLFERARTASESERLQIEQRAIQLLQQLEQLGVSVSAPDVQTGRPLRRPGQ